ncbi:MAG: MFS transporter [Rickettsiaceae bacterium]|nr:MFS transporter [Rickettsiaceae bacterium]
MQAGLFRSKSSLIIWFSLVLFFAFQFILRLVPGILREELMIRYSLSTVEFGRLAAYYYLGYAGMQIPIGYLLDKYNVKTVSFLSIIVTIIGALIFAYAEDWNYILASRLIIGMGSAAAFLSVAKASAYYFHEKYMNTLIGFAFTFGLLGAVAGGQPTKELLDTVGFQNGITIIASIFFLIGLIVVVVKPSKSREFLKHSPIKFSEIFSTSFNPYVLYIGICGGLMVGSLEGFADIWSIVFFRQIYHFSVSQSLNAAFSVYIGMCVGGPLLAYAADKTRSSTLIIFLTGIFVTGIFMILFILKSPNFYLVAFLMFVLGILCSYQVLVFSTITELFSKDKSALAISVVNCINMSFGYLFHIIISHLIQQSWNGNTDLHNVPIYDLEALKNGLRIIPILCLVGASGFIVLPFKLQRNATIATKVN